MLLNCLLHLTLVCIHLCLCLCNCFAPLLHYIMVLSSVLSFEAGLVLIMRPRRPPLARGGVGAGSKVAFWGGEVNGLFTLRRFRCQKKKRLKSIEKLLDDGERRETDVHVCVCTI